jgi:hypothetical protein
MVNEFGGIRGGRSVYYRNRVNLANIFLAQAQPNKFMISTLSPFVRVLCPTGDQANRVEHILQASGWRFL